MPDTLTQLRAASAAVAERARAVRVRTEAIPAYAASLPLAPAPAELDPEVHLVTGPPEGRAAFWLTLDAINFGSGWFPTLRKRSGRSGYFTVAIGLREHFAVHGPWSSGELGRLSARDLARVLGQEPDHPLMELFARSLRDLGRHVEREHAGRFLDLLGSAGGSALVLAERLAGWECYADVSAYDELVLPFLKRAQIATADLARAGLAGWDDLNRLTMFADNLVPHVLRLDGILRFDPGLVARIDRGELIVHGSPEEVEIRACALHAVELMVAARADTCAAEIDALLWNRGRGARYKAARRHRSRCTAY